MEYMQTLPPVDITKYGWKQSPQNEHVWQRKALTRENHWYHKPVRLRGIFIGGSVSLATKTNLDIFRRAAEAAWLRVRFEHPEIAMTSEAGTDGQVWMSCPIAKCDEDAQCWVEETLSVESMEKGYSFHDTRMEVWKSDESSSNLLRLHVPSADPVSSILSFDFTFCLDHHFVDGVGGRMLVGSFFKFLASTLYQGPSSLKSSLAWQKSLENLAPPWIEMLNGDQEVSGSAFDEAVRRDSELLIDHRVRIGAVDLDC